jgi:hypothetical protein
MAFFFFLIKRSKNQVRKNASLPHNASPCRAHKNHGPGPFAPICRTSPALQAKLPMPFAIAQAISFYLPSPEAFFLTVSI